MFRKMAKKTRDAVFVEGGGILGGQTSIPAMLVLSFFRFDVSLPLAKVETEIVITTP